MTRPSKIDRLAPEIRELIADLNGRGRTLDEILSKLRELLPEEELPSRSGLGRHTKQLDAIASEIRRSQGIAEALVKRYGDAPESRVGRLNITMTHSLINRMMFSEEGEVLKLDPKEAMFLSTALQKLAQAEKQDLEREARRKKEFLAEVGAKLDAAERELEDGAPADPREVLRRIREEVYGIFQ